MNNKWFEDRRILSKYDWVLKTVKMLGKMTEAGRVLRETVMEIFSSCNRDKIVNYIAKELRKKMRK